MVAAGSGGQLELTTHAHVRRFALPPYDLTMDHQKRINLAIIKMQQDGLDQCFRPAEVTERLSSFSVAIGADRLIQRVPVEPFHGTICGRCFDNCSHVNEALGGKVIHGWAWHQVRNLFVVAEFHAVWQARDGQLIDVTPPVLPRPITTFSCDPVRVAADIPCDLPRNSLEALYKSSEPNRRFALKDDQDVHEWICAEEASAALNAKRFDGEEIRLAEVVSVLERNANARARLMKRIRRMPNDM